MPSPERSARASRFAIRRAFVGGALAALAAIVAPRAPAALPPGSYDILRKEAPEALIVRIDEVKTADEAGGAVDVTATGAVLRVERSATGLAAGKPITIRYRVPPRGLVGPRNAAVIEKGGVYPAFLRRSEGASTYELAAYGESFTMTPEQ